MEEKRSHDDIMAERVVWLTYLGCFFTFMASVAVCLWVIIKLVQWMVS
jgi:hypothetical protein